MIRGLLTTQLRDERKSRNLYNIYVYFGNLQVAGRSDFVHLYELVNTVSRHDSNQICLTSRCNGRCQRNQTPMNVAGKRKLVLAEEWAK